MVSKVARDSLYGSQERENYSSILKLAIGGKTKSEIVKALAISPQQFRRILAELADRGFVRVDSRKHVVITTDRGLTFLSDPSKNKK